MIKLKFGWGGLILIHRLLHFHHEVVGVLIPHVVIPHVVIPHEVIPHLVVVINCLIAYYYLVVKLYYLVVKLVGYYY